MMLLDNVNETPVEDCLFRDESATLLRLFDRRTFVGASVAEAAAVPFILRRFKFSMRKSIKGEYNEAILACLVYLINIQIKSFNCGIEFCLINTLSSLYRLS